MLGVLRLTQTITTFSVKTRHVEIKQEVLSFKTFIAFEESEDFFRKHFRNRRGKKNVNFQSFLHLVAKVRVCRNWVT